MDFQTTEEACRGYWVHISFGITEVPPTDLTTAMIRASLNVAAGDENLSTEERTTAAAAAIVTGLSSKQFQEFLTEVERTSAKIKMGVKLLSKVPNEFKLAALYYSCFVAAVDGFDDAMKKIGAKMGVDESTVTLAMYL